MSTQTVEIVLASIAVIAGLVSIGWVIREDIRAREELREVDRWIREQDMARRIRDEHPRPPRKIN